jgi:hypothetical protein
MGRTCNARGRGEKYNILVGISEGKRPLGRPKCRWEDNIYMNIRKLRLGDVNWI